MQNNSIMKKLLVLLFSILISFNTYGEWVKVSTTIDGTEYYVEIDTIKEHNGYVYSWRLGNYLVPTNIGHLSDKLYLQYDCGVYRQKILSWNFYTQPMGKGPSLNDNIADPWDYPTTESSAWAVLDFVCKYVN